MRKEILYTLKSPYRDDLRITGYKFGRGDKKAACIVGSLRGNEIQQLYICSQLIKELKKLEKNGCILHDNEIMVIPSVNHYSMNIGKRFWPIDNTDINRMFPGNKEGETTERIAGNLFEKIQGYTYGIQFVSFYMPGDFIPHVRLMKTGYESESLANLFGLPYVLLRNPNPFDTKTLNYNWQLSNTNTFSVYTNSTEEIDEKSAKHAVVSVLRFLTRMGIIKYNCHSGYIASIIAEDNLMSVRVEKSGIYKRLKNPGDSVYGGEVIGEIYHPYEGELIAQVISPTEGIVFFAHKKPTVVEDAIVYKIIKRIHE